MNTIDQDSRLAKEKLLKKEGGPHLLCNWVNFVFIHYEADANILQKQIPYPLDLYNGRAFISLVAFTLEEFRFSKFEPLSKWLTKPIATQHYFNVRTYVRHGNEKGIYFVREWISNALCAFIGSKMYELPCHHGYLHYSQDKDSGELTGRILPKYMAGEYSYRMEIPKEEKLEHVKKGSLDQFLLERYIAFVKGRRRGRYFRIWHNPWLQVKADPHRLDDHLMDKIGPWGSTLKFAGAHYSPGVMNVWMGKPQRV